MELDFNVFDTLEETAIDYRTAHLVATAARKEALELVKDIEMLHRADREKRAIRISELEAEIADSSRSVTVRRMRENELTALEQDRQQFTITPIERQAFEDAAAELAQAVEDTVSLRKKLTGLFAEARAALVELRESTLGNTTMDPLLVSRYCEEVRTQFEDMCRRVEVEAE